MTDGIQYYLNELTHHIEILRTAREEADDKIRERPVSPGEDPERTADLDNAYKVGFLTARCFATADMLETFQRRLGRDLTDATVLQDWIEELVEAYQQQIAEEVQAQHCKEGICDHEEHARVYDPEGILEKEGA